MHTIKFKFNTKFNIKFTFLQKGVTSIESINLFSVYL